MKKSNELKAIFLSLLCILAWSFIPVISKFGQSDLDNFQFLFWSNLLSTLVILISILVMKKTKGIFNYKVVEFSSFAFLGFLGSCLYYLCLYYGYAKGEGIQVLVLQYTWPIWITILSYIILNEELTFRRVGAAVLGFIGVVVILTKGEITAFNIPNPSLFIVVLVGAISFALFSVLSKKIKSDSFHSVFYYFLFATLFSVLSLMIFSSFKTPSTSSWPFLVINGGVINGISYLLWIKALQLVDSSRIAPLVFLAPVLSCVWIVLFFDEIFLPVYYLGITLTVFSGAISK